MRLLLTGADGFVGKFIKEIVPCISLNEPNGFVDITDREAVLRAVETINPDTVIHLASQSFVPESFKCPRQTYEVNFLGTFNLLEGLKATGFRGRMLYVGSSDVYGAVPFDNMPIVEEQPLRPRSPYAVSKVASEMLCYQWSQSELFDIMMVRPFNHIGPGQNERFVVSDFAKQIVSIHQGQRKSVLTVGDIDVSRDFCDVRDVVRAYVLMLEHGKNGEVYNVCSGVSRSIRSLVELMCAEIGVDVELEKNADRMRKSEQRIVCGDPSKIKNLCGWESAITLDKSIKDILSFWENKVNE